MPVPARFGNLRHTALSAFWFGNFFMWQPLTTIVIQNQIDAVVPKANQGTAIGLAVVVVLTLIPTSLAAKGEGSQPLPPLVHKPPREAIYDFFKPMLGGDFAWVIFTRFFVSAGITAVAYYLNNFFRDVTGVGDPAT